jgi:hypothetical protein
MRVAPIMRTVTRLYGTGASAAASSSFTTRLAAWSSPRPPRRAGQVGTAHPSA